MSQPRRVLPGMTVMVTRRTLRRTHLLRPDRELNNLFLYCLAVLTRRYGIALHAVVVMSTHEHLVLTDTRGQLPRFLQDLHRLLALGIKVMRRWEGAVWDHEKPSVVELRTGQAVIETMAYVLANPVAAGLVRHSHQWPGVTLAATHNENLRVTATRPEAYFDQQNPSWPDTALLTLAAPSVGVAADVLHEQVVVELARLEADAHSTVTKRGGRFMKPKQISKLSPYDRATTWEPLRDRNPHFAVGRGQRGAFFEAVLVLRAFRKAHREALELWRTGVRDVVFPLGTWLMSWSHAACVQL
ncbi:MAG TPA: transposase [Polyangiales bacterium]|nr:transposase [Polyangiales bacterium]